MKEVYFTASTTTEKAKQLLLELSAYRRQRKWSLSKNNSALLILDMQDYFLNRLSHAFIPSAPAIMPAIKELQEHFLLRKYSSVIQTRHINTPQNAKQMKTWWHDLITSENSLHDIHSDLNTNQSLIIEKTQYDAFYETELENILHTRNITQVIITGVMTHLCCESTARSAFIRGFEVFLVVDATATYNWQFHKASVLTLSHGFAIPVLAEEILKSLNND